MSPNVSVSAAAVKRLLEIIPGFTSWSVLILLIGLFIFRPFVAAIVLIVFLLFWVCRLCYMSLLLIMAHHRVASSRNDDWLSRCHDIKTDFNFDAIIHVVLYTIYKEPKQVIEDSLNSLKGISYPPDRIIIVLAGEERAVGSYERLKEFQARYRPFFHDVIVTMHPKNVPGEIPAKGANATYAARQIKEYLDKNGIDLARVIISCFDADTCVDKNYFACLSYNFLRHPNRYNVSFQPFPVYSNNIYTAPAFARVVEMGSTFWQLIDSMRYEKFITFSSHSMSFKTLVCVDYWPVHLVSDDSLIFWKCYVKYNGDYRTYPLEVPVFMDIAVGRNLIDTVRVQYKQKRRWAWGVENFVFLGLEFISNRHFSRWEKIRRLFQILDNHVGWATWAIIISFLTPLMLFWGKLILKDSLVLFNLSYINSIIFNALTLTLILCIVMSMEFLPPRPKNISRLIYLVFVFQWLLVPFISAILGSFPALDAQTRLMFGRYLYFFPTPKKR